MPVLIGIPVLILTLVLQTTAFSRLPLLYGTADIVLLVILAWNLNERVKHGWEWVVLAGLMVSFVSALPLFLPIVGYILAAGLAYWLKKRIWQTPVLAMLFSTFLGTIMIQSLSLFTLNILGSNISTPVGFSLVILPSALWNLILAVPVYTLVGEMAAWIYPREND
jgi:cell shape-determining protein MreD